MKIKTEIIFDSGTPDSCFSVRKQNYIEIEGVKNYLGQAHRCTFCPGEFDEIKAYAPELEEMAKALWTPKVIAAWDAKQNQFYLDLC